MASSGCGPSWPGWADRTVPAREMLVVYRNFLGESHPAAGERPEGVFGGRGERVEGARSESGAAREQAVVGEGVEGFSQYRRGVHDDLPAGGTAAQYAGERSARTRGPRTAVFAAVDGSSTRSRAYESRASAFLRPPE